MYGMTIGLHEDTLNGLIGQLKKGLPVSSLTTLSDQLGVSEKRLIETVNIAQRTVTRRKKEGRFKSDESERVFRIVRLYERAIETMGTNELAKHWFRTPIPALDGKTPLEFADTEPGAQQVEALLELFEDGAII